MKQYPIVVYWSDEDDAWIADVPDLEAFSAHGATPEEAVREVRVALKSLFIAAQEQGLDLPEPSSPQLVKAGTTVRESS